MNRSIGVSFPQKTASHQGSKTSSELCQFSSASPYSIDYSTPVVVQHQWRSKHFLGPNAANDGEHHDVTFRRKVFDNGGNFLCVLKYKDNCKENKI